MVWYRQGLVKAIWTSLPDNIDTCGARTLRWGPGPTGRVQHRALPCLWPRTQLAGCKRTAGVHRFTFWQLFRVRSVRPLLVTTDREMISPRRNDRRPIFSSPKFRFNVLGPPWPAALRTRAPSRTSSAGQIEDFCRVPVPPARQALRRPLGISGYRRTLSI